MDNERLVENITKAIGYTENGGKPNLKNLKAGKTGEMRSIFQFTPDTWKNYSTEVFGKVVPLDPDAETYVTKQKVSSWLKKGYKPEQILSIWNAGQGEPDAYSGKFSTGKPSKGVNKKYGVAFDVPGYVKKGMGYLNKFSAEPVVAGQQQPTTRPATQPPQGDNSPLQKIMSLMSKTIAPKSASTKKTPGTTPGLISKFTPTV